MVSDNAARRVRAVRLRAPSADLIRHGALLLEDALHTASLPETDPGRVLIVRSLAVGRIARGQSPSALALRIEERVRGLVASAIYAADPAARESAAVFFRDDVEPTVLLARRIAGRADTSDWFWPLALPGWNPGLERGAALRGLLHGLAARPGGAVAVATLIEDLGQRRLLDEVLSQLREPDGPDLLRQAGWSRPPGSRLAHRPPTLPGAGLLAPWRDIVARWIDRWGADDARSVWLVAMILVAARPGRAADPDLPARSTDLVAALAASIRTKSAPPAVARRPDGPSGPGDPHPPLPDRPARPAPPRMIGDGSTELPPAAAPRFSGSSLTLHAGLYFLLPVLIRLGFPDWVAAHPSEIERDLPERLLRHAARRLRIPANDPVLRPLSEHLLGERPARSDALGRSRAGARRDRSGGLDALPDTPSARGFMVPTVWRRGIAEPGNRLVRLGDRPGAARILLDGSGRLPLALWRGRAPADARRLLDGSPIARGGGPRWRSDRAVVLDAWWLAIDRWCRRVAGIRPGDLVRRPGRIEATRTHFDIVFDLASADIRVRRAGLDLDPGWLPWLGRIVAFHYVTGGDVDGPD